MVLGELDRTKSYVDKILEDPFAYEPCSNRKETKEMTCQ